MCIGSCDESLKWLKIIICSLVIMILLYCNNIHVHRHQNKNMSAWLLYSGYFLSVEFCFYKKRKIFVRPIFVPAALIYYVHAYNNCYSWVKVSLFQFQNKKQWNFDLTKNMHYMYKVMQNIKKINNHQCKCVCCGKRTYPQCNSTISSVVHDNRSKVFRQAITHKPLCVVVTTAS